MKANLTKSLSDKNNPELITYWKPQEIEKISIIEAFTDEENAARKVLKLEDNPFTEVIHYLRLNRCSVNGFRSEQLVKVINTKSDAEASGKLLEVKGVSQ